MLFIPRNKHKPNRQENTTKGKNRGFATTGRLYIRARIVPFAFMLCLIGTTFFVLAVCRPLVEGFFPCPDGIAYTEYRPWRHPVFSLLFVFLHTATGQRTTSRKTDPNLHSDAAQALSVHMTHIEERFESLAHSALAPLACHR